MGWECRICRPRNPEPNCQGPHRKMQPTQAGVDAFAPDRTFPPSFGEPAFPARLVSYFLNQEKGLRLRQERSADCNLQVMTQHRSAPLLPLTRGDFRQRARVSVSTAQSPSGDGPARTLRDTEFHAGAGCRTAAASLAL